MNSSDELRQENAALRERISRLNAAILRISASLDLDTVLHEVVDGSRALTGTRYGMIATVDEGGAIQEFIASGLSVDERRHMAVAGGESCDPTPVRGDAPADLSPAGADGLTDDWGRRRSGRRAGATGERCPTNVTESGRFRHVRPQCEPH